MMSDQYYNMGYNGASSWGNGYPVPPGQPPAPPSQPPPPPPDDTNPPPPPGEGKPPSPKRLKASIEGKPLKFIEYISGGDPAEMLFGVQEGFVSNLMHTTGLRT